MTHARTTEEKKRNMGKRKQKTKRENQDVKINSIKQLSLS
jgi:hypothetical protein